MATLTEYTRGWSRKFTNDALQEFKLRVAKDDCCQTIGLISQDGLTATLPDGRLVGVILGGKASPNTYCPMMRITENVYIALVEEKKYIHTDTPVSNAFILESIEVTPDEDNPYDFALFVRKIGSSERHGWHRTFYRDFVEAHIAGTWGLHTNPNVGATTPRIDQQIVAQTGGFSANGKCMYIGGVVNVTKTSPHNPGGHTHPQTHQFREGVYQNENFIMWYVTYKNFNLSLETINGESFKVIIADEIKINSIDVSDVWRHNVKPHIDAPNEAQNGVDAVRGLAGGDRSNHIYLHYYTGGTDPGITIQNIVDFIQDVADFYDMTFDEVAAMLPPNIWLLAVLDQFHGKFYPATLVQYDVDTPLITTDYESVFHQPPGIFDPPTVSVQNHDDGHCATPWTWDRTTFQPNMKQSGFVFTNDEDGEPVIDIVISYITTVVYFVTSYSMHTTLHWIRPQQCFRPQGGNVILFDFTYSRFNTGPGEFYGYHIDVNTIYDPFVSPSSEVFGTIGPWFETFGFKSFYYSRDFLDTTTWSIDPLISSAGPETTGNYGVYVNSLTSSLNSPTLLSNQRKYSNYNFKMTSGGYWLFCNSSSTSPCDNGEYGEQSLYSQRFFTEYYNDPRCGFLPGCPYTEVNGSCAVASDIAMVEGFGSLHGTLVLLGFPTSGFYTFTRFDGSTVPNFTLIPDDPFAYALWQTAFQISFGNWGVREDAFNVNWPGNNPFASIYETGTGIMAIKDVQTIEAGSQGSLSEFDSRVTYVDRPMPAVHNYNQLWRTFRAPDGGRALLIRNNFFASVDNQQGIFAWNRDYTSISAGNQELYTKPPDLISDKIVVTNQTFPYYADLGKYIYSDKLTAYYKLDLRNIATNEIVLKEYLFNVITPINGDPITLAESVSGIRPPETGEGALVATVLDYIIKEN